MTSGKVNELFQGVREKFKFGYDASKSTNSIPDDDFIEWTVDYNEENELLCDPNMYDPECTRFIGLLNLVVDPSGLTLVTPHAPCKDDSDGYQALYDFGCCTVPEDELRRQLVSFTVPNPSASSSSSRRCMEEETGAIAGAADFGATIKLSSSLSSSVTASGPFPLWATTTLVIALVAGWSL